MKKKNVVRRNSGFIVGCVLAAGASFFTADTLTSGRLPVMTPSTEGMLSEAPVKEVAPEQAESRVYETDAFTVTASGNIIKGVETEPVQRETTPQTDENGNPITPETDENGNVISGGSSQDSGYYDDGSGSGSYSGDGSYSDGSYDDGGYSDGSYDDGSGYSDGGYSDGSYSGDGGYSDGSGYDDGSYTGPAIEIYDPGNGDYTYSDDSGSSTPSTPDDVIIWGISSRYIDESELYNYNAGQLRLIRNEIFALHGRIFRSQDLADYFSQKSWYVPTYAPDDFDANMFYYLNDYEEANLQVILNYEAALAGN